MRQKSIQSERDIKPSFGREIVGHQIDVIDRKRHIRETSETGNDRVLKKTIYPAAPRPALLRVFLSLDYSLCNSQKMLKNARPVLPHAMKRKPELAERGLIPESRTRCADKTDDKEMVSIIM